MKDIATGILHPDRDDSGNFRRNSFKEFLLGLLRLSYKYIVKYIHSRNELPYILNGMNLIDQGAEIGVKEGVYSEPLRAGCST